MQPAVYFPQQISPSLINEQTQQNIVHDAPSNKYFTGQPPYVLMSPSHPMMGPGPQPSMSGFHPMPMLPHVYMDPMNCSPNGTNLYAPVGQQMISAPPPQQSSPTFPVFYSSSPTAPMTPWISAGPSPLPPPYFVFPNPQQAPHFPFQQLI